MTIQLLSWINDATRILMLLATALVLILFLIRLFILLWEEITRRNIRWMEPVFEEYLRGPVETLPASFFRLRWPLRRLLQYMIIRRSFGKTDTGRARIAEAYDQLGFINVDLRRLGSWFWWVRAEGARCLGQMKSRKAKPALLRGLQDPVLEVKLLCAWSLGRIGDPDSIRPSIEALVKSSRLAGMRLSSTVFELGEKAVAPIIETLEHSDPAIRILALHLLGELRSTRAILTITKKIASEENKEVRVAAYKALGSIADVMTLPQLILGLEDPAWEVRAQAARGLGLVGTPEVLGHLSQALEDHKWWVRRNAGEALSKLNTEGKEVLLKAYRKSRHKDAREMAAQWLDELGYLPSTT